MEEVVGSCDRIFNTDSAAKILLKEYKVVFIVWF